MSSLQDIEWESCLLPKNSDPQLAQRLESQFGELPEGVHYFTESTWISEGVAALNEQLFTRVHLDRELADRVGVVVSHDNACRYCYAAHRALLRILGYSEEFIREVEQEFLTGDFGERERAAFDFARKISRSNPLPTPEDCDKVRAAGFSEMELKELSVYIVLNIFFNRLSTLAALPPQGFERLPDRWYMRLMRPMAARQVRRFLRQGKPQPLREDQKTGPFSDVVCALDGLPMAGAIRFFIDAAWASPILPVRAKALTFAVIARGLGCIHSEQEATRLAVEAGLSEKTVAEALDHLASPDLDPLESVAVRFARETIWYEPAPLQRRAREIRDSLPREQFLELLATTSIANTVCRLCAVSAASR